MTSENTLKKAFGATLRKVRKSKGFTQESLAAEAELDRSYISLIERGINQPSLHVIYKLSHTLRISPTQLMTQLQQELEPSIK